MADFDFSGLEEICDDLEFNFDDISVCCPSDEMLLRDAEIARLRRKYAERNLECYQLREEIENLLTERETDKCERSKMEERLYHGEGDLASERALNDAMHDARCPNCDYPVSEWDSFSR